MFYMYTRGFMLSEPIGRLQVLDFPVKTRGRRSARASSHAFGASHRRVCKIRIADYFS